MTRQQFDAVFDRLTPRRKEVLLKFLANETDEAIAQSLHITKATVRKTIEKICEQFGLKNSFPDERRSKRQDLVALFAKYKPDLLSGCASVVENDGASTNLKTPVSQGDESDLDALVEKVRSHPHCRDKIQEQCGRLRILDVEWPVGIDNIYIDVNVLEKLPSNRRLELSDFHGFNPATDDFDRLGLGNVREAQVPGLEAVATYSKLMVLGKPGSGKTTFLKFLAIQCIRGEFQKERIPIFIELKIFAKDAKRKGEFSLLNYINQELCICDVQAQQVEELLHQGKFFILLDGLDEVKADIGDKTLTEVGDFAGKYFRNHYVITCRIAAQFANQRYSLSFIDVEVADFDEEQIEAFAEKWFVKVARNSKEKGLIKAGQFIEKLYLPETQQIRKLAGTPILLNLICLVFLEKADFPSKRYKLYEQGLGILLERWDESRNIKRDEAYQKLSLEDKKELLNQVAFITFERGDYFFEQDQIQQYIADYLRTLPDAQTQPKALKRDSKAVLKSIEAQHGLLVERAREIYSFSHLTFQEYFTAKQIVDYSESQALERLVNYVMQPRWREVFLLVVSMFPSADYILLLMKHQTDRILDSDEELQQFITWINTKSSTAYVAYYTETAIRAFYFEFACRPYLFYPLEDLVPSVFTEALKKEYNFIFINLDIELNLLKYDETALDVRLLKIYNGLCQGYIDNVDLEEAIEILERIPGDGDLYELLQKIKVQAKYLKKINNKTESKEWFKDNGYACGKELRTMIIKYRNIGHEWQFNACQQELLQQYYEANKLLVECLNSSCNVSSEARQEIEETLFLPKR